MSPDDEREAFWKALHLNSDRITELEAVVNTRNEMMRESIQSAVRDAMPKTLVSDYEHAFLRMLMEREERSAKFQQRVIDSSVVWAVPTLLGGILWILWKLVSAWLSARGLWKE
jgi:CHASE3 domain sensor protein